MFGRNRTISGVVCLIFIIVERVASLNLPTRHYLATDLNVHTPTGDAAVIESTTITALAVGSRRIGWIPHCLAVALDRKESQRCIQSFIEQTAFDTDFIAASGDRFK